MSRPGRRRAGATTPVLWVAAFVSAALAVLPLVYLVWRAAESGGANTIEVATSARALGLLVRTTGLAFAVTTTAVCIGVPTAWLLTRTDLPGRRFFSVAAALPLAIPTYVGAYAFISALGPRGTLAGWLRPLGVDTLPQLYGLPGAWLVLSLFTYPYVLLTVRGGIRGLDPSIEETSRTLGASYSETLRKIVLPRLWPAIGAGALLVTTYTLSDFGAVALLRFDSFTRVIFLQYRSSLDRSTAAVLALMLALLTLVILMLDGAVRTRRAGFRVHAGSSRPPTIQPLGRWRWPAFAAMCALISVALVLPLSVISSWALRGSRVGGANSPVLEAMGNSLTAALLGATATVAMAWPIAVVSVRRGGWAARVVEGAAWLGHSLPGIVVALSLVFFGIRVAPWLYQTRAGLTLAYVVLFLPVALGAIRSSLMNINPSLEDASKLMGRGSATTFIRVVAPLARGGIISGGILVFLTVMKELPATLLLSPTGHRTLATEVWSTTSEALFARAALPALLLVVTAALPLALVGMREPS